MSAVCFNLHIKYEFVSWPETCMEVMRTSVIFADTLNLSVKPFFAAQSDLNFDLVGRLHHKLFFPCAVIEL